MPLRRVLIEGMWRAVKVQRSPRNFYEIIRIDRADVNETMPIRVDIAKYLSWPENTRIKRALLRGNPIRFDNKGDDR